MFYLCPQICPNSSPIWKTTKHQQGGAAAEGYAMLLKNTCISLEIHHETQTQFNNSVGLLGHFNIIIAIPKTCCALVMRLYLV